MEENGSKKEQGTAAAPESAASAQAAPESAFISAPDASGVRYYQSSVRPQTKPRAKKETQKDGGGHLRNSLIVLAGILVGLMVLGTACNSLLTSDNAESLPSGPYIATVYIEGTLQRGAGDAWSSAGYQHNWTLNRLDALMWDENNEGLILFIDSPGGGVYESDELYMKIKEYQDYTQRPVYAALGSIAASGGYYIAAPADKIIANRNCLTGSIGVTIGTVIDLSEFLERYGIRTETIASGENKAMGSYFETMTGEQRIIFQSIVDEAHDQFVEVIAEGRGMDLDEVRMLADGRIYTAKQALDAGLLDDIGTLDEAISDMKSEYDLWYCTVADIYYVDTSIFGWLFSQVGGNLFGARGDAAALLDLVESQNQFPISYLCEMLR